MPNNFSYTLNIPDAPNNPSVDQPNMKVNTNSIDDLLDVDHVSFNDNNGGIHRQVRMRNQGAPGLGDGEGCLYADQVNGNSWPIWQNAIGTYEIIAFPVSLPPGPDFTQGVVPLAGKMIMQFGKVDTTTNGNNNATVVSFPATFPNQVYNIQVTTKLNTFNTNQSWGVKLNDLTSFNLFTSSGVPVGTTFYWQAIRSY